MTKKPRVARTYSLDRLIPIETHTTNLKPTPEMMREYATTLVDAWNKHATPAMIALADQGRAAERDMSRQLKNDPLPDGFTHNETTTDATARRLAVTLAMARNIEARCRHITWPPEQPKTLVCLTSRAAVCPRPACTELLKARWHDNGHCDLCEEPSDWFIPIIAPVGPCVVSLEACEPCAAFLKGAP